VAAQGRTFSIDNRQSAIGNENLVSRISLFQQVDFANFSSSERHAQRLDFQRPEVPGPAPVH
jgi:hypothetical protein